MMLEKKTRSKKKKEKDLSPRSLSRICSNIFANDGEAEEVLGAIVNVVNGVVVSVVLVGVVLVLVLVFLLIFLLAFLLLFLVVVVFPFSVVW